MLMPLNRLLLSFLLFSSLTVQAQLAREPVNVQSPNAGSLGLYGEVPVSHFTGVPSIQIPLYQLQEGPITVPISLSYHASGFRPDMHPGWVGVGWSLSAGGTITRTIHNWPDEMNWPGTTGTSNLTNVGFCYNFTDPYLNRDSWDRVSAQCGLISSADAGLPSLAGFRRDTEPDEFSFNFAGYSGKFYWTTTGNGNTTGKWRVQCDKPLKVEFINPPSPQSPALLDVPIVALTGTIFSRGGYPKSFSGFVIITEDGTRYQFGGTGSAIEYTLDLYNQKNDYWKASAWNLTKITSPDGREVTFHYEASLTTFVCQMYLSQSYRTYNVPQGGSADPACSGGTRGANTYIGQLIRPVYLADINSSTATVGFSSSYTNELSYGTDIFQYQFNLWQPNGYNTGPFLPFITGDVNSPYPAVSHPAQQAANLNLAEQIGLLKWKKLTSITVNRVGHNTHQFSFLYDENASKRLVLTEVREEASSNSIHNTSTLAKPSYYFGYNKKAIFSLAYLQPTTDHWGFYNATNSNLSQFGTSLSNLGGYYARRQPNPDSAIYLSGLLTKIRYPTGGITTFEYEQNSYSKQVGLNRSQPPNTLPADQPAGGVRIARIKTFTKSSAQPVLTKKYFYTSGYFNSTAAAQPALRSSGILGGQIQYFDPGYRYHACNCGAVPCAGNGVQYYDYTMFSTQPALPACYTGQGSPIGYSEVTEQLGDGSYTKYHFSNFDTGNVDDVPQDWATIQPGRTAYSPYASREHERGKVVRQTMYSASDVRVKDKTTSYFAYNKLQEYARSVQAGYFNICSNTAVSIYTGVAHRYYTYPYLPQSETETIYDATGGNPVTTTTTLAYNQVTADFNSRLIARQSRVNSKGETEANAFYYPFDYPYPSAQAPSTDPAASALVAMVGKNMLAYPVEVRAYTSSLLKAATIHTYKGVTLNGIANARIFPYQTFSFESTQPAAGYAGVQFGASSPFPLVINNNDSRVKLKLTFDSYDAKGNVLGLTKQGNKRTAYQWGYGQNLLIAQVENALPSEVLTCNFEDRIGWNASTLQYAERDYDGSVFINRARTGLVAGVINNTTAGTAVHSFSTTPLTISLAAPKRFIFSAWVKSEGPVAQIWLFRDSTTDPTPAVASTSETGKWVHIEQEVLVPSNVTLLTLRLSNQYAGSGGRVWFDDVRLYPSDAQMSTYTHSPLIGITSKSDAANNPVLYEYDGLNRLSLVRDKDGNIIKKVTYKYKGQ